MTFLDTLPFPWSDPKAQKLKELLASNVSTVEEIRVVIAEAKLPIGKYNLGFTPELNWHFAIDTTAKMGPAALRNLLAQVEKQQGKAIGDRIRELDSEQRELDRAAPSNGEEWIDTAPVSDGELERVFGNGSLLDVAFLELGLRRAKAVVRIQATYDLGVATGTGFLIAPDLVLSNHHVLLAAGAPSEVAVWFDYENTVAGVERPHTEVEGLVDSIVGDQPADWAVVRLAKPAAEGYEPLSLFPSAAAAAGDRCYIVQHPGGGPKQLGIHKNLVRHADEKVVQYFTDTMGGSSGSPVFNRSWEVVALHHRNIKVTLANKRVEVRNQGIAIARVTAGLASAGLLPAQQTASAG